MSYDRFDFFEMDSLKRDWMITDSYTVFSRWSRDDKLIMWFDLATYFLALEKMDADKLQSQMVYLKGLLEMENWRFDTNIVRRIYSLMASLATAQDQELLIFINKQIRHFDLGFNLFFEAQTLALSIVFFYIGESNWPIAQMHFDEFLWSFGLVNKLLLDLFNPILDAKRQRVGIIGAIQAIGVLGEKGRNHLINTDGTFLIV